MTGAKRKRKHGGGHRRRALGHSVPFRSCVACRRSAPRSELLRFARTPDGTIVADVAARAPGRGAWTCASVVCVSRAAERGAFERAFGAPVLGRAAPLVQAVQSALAQVGAPATLAAAFAASRSIEDFSPGRLAHPRGRA